jgi:hypothetical protein
MANVFKRAALAFGRWTGLRRETGVEGDPGLALIDPVAHEMAEISQPVETIDSLIERSGNEPELPPLPMDSPRDLWNETFEAPTAVATQDTEAAIATGQISEPATAGAIDATLAAPDQPTTPVPVGFINEPLVASATATPAIVEETKPVVELKPAQPIEVATVPTPTASVSFTQLYELIANEVNKRTDSAINVYERLLAVTREELENTRRSNRLAWSVGGVMTAITAFGAIWAAGEVSATRVELGSLKQQVTLGQQASTERDVLRTELRQAREASAKMEMDSLRARLDQALAVSVERDRLRGELELAKKAKQESEAELRVVRAAASTQPVSQATPASSGSAKLLGDRVAVDTGSPSPRQDVWSMLLDGHIDR